MTYLSSEFLAKYEGLRPRHAGVMFDVIYLRTYSRWVEEKGRREHWLETVERVVNYNMSLYSGPVHKSILVGEAEELFDKIFHLELLPAGRTLWIGGTKASERQGEANYNCCAVIIDELEAITDLFHLLLCGCGVGFRVLPEDVAKLPNMGIDIQVTHRPYEPAVKGLEHTWHLKTNNHWKIFVGDSREGWVTALRLFLEACRECGARIEMDYSAVRPAGSRIKTFGGRAPGPDGIKEMFTKITKVINAANGKLSAVDVMDICNLIGKNVIIGGTRRSSQITLASVYDEEFMDAKQPDNFSANRHRAMSNNSAIFLSDPSKEELNRIFERAKYNGEPGISNLAAARRRRPMAELSNPCHEILLDSRGVCNLSTVNLMAFLKNGVFDQDGALRAITLATRVGARATNVTMSLPKWDAVQKRDRLLGVSIAGIMDLFDLLDIEFDSPQAISIFKSLRERANEEARNYAFELRIPAPLLVTTIKPDGTLSKLPTVSSGMTRSRAPYYLRRVRVSDLDPVCSALKELGVPNEPDIEKAERTVFSFPISSGAKIGVDDEPAKRQFERYLTVMKYYVDHNASCTLTVGEDEWEEIENLVAENIKDVVACAFLPKDTSAYPQLPEEAISEEQYKEMIKTFPDLSGLAELVNKYENEEYEGELIEDACQSGYCPVR